MEIHFMLKSMGSKINGTTKTISKFILKWKSKENEKKCRTISHLYPNNQIVIKTRKNEEQSDNITLNKHTWKCSSLARFVRLFVPVFFPLKKTEASKRVLFSTFSFSAFSSYIYSVSTLLHSKKKKLFEYPLVICQHLIPDGPFPPPHQTF